MPVFENPMNGYRENVGLGTVIGVALLGVLYLIYRGLWGYALLWFLVVPFTTLALAILAGDRGMFDGPLWLPVMIIAAPHLAFSAFSVVVLEKKYLRQGWRQVDA